MHTVTGLPWIVALPLTALFVRGVIVAPLLIYTRRMTQRRLALHPLLAAWAHQTRRQVLEQSRDQPLLPAEFEKRFKTAMRAKQRELTKRWGCEGWRALPVLGQLPVFLAVVETIRRMCGTTGGIFGLLTMQGATPVDAPRDEVLQSIDTSGPGLIGIDPSLADEGGLWFPDLLLPDPWYTLPWVLTGLVYANISLGAKRPSMLTPSTFQRRLTTTLKIGALLIGPFTLTVPSAVLVYWISSTAFAICQNLLIDTYMPLTSPLPEMRKKDAFRVTKKLPSAQNL